MGYQYRGTVRDVDDTPAPRVQNLDGFDSSACGTYAGYRRHQTHNVPTCQDCKDAMASYSRDHYQPRPRKGFTTELCGTYPGKRRHDYHGVPACDPCKAATRAYQRAWRAARKVKATLILREECGTYSGYMRHKRDEGVACELCLAAYAEYMRQYRARKAAA